MINLQRNIYKESIKAFKKLLKYNKMLTMEEYDKYARENDLFSSTTLVAKENVKNFEELKAIYKNPFVRLGNNK